MLTIPGRNSAFCDGLARRSFLKIGSLALGGISLPDILRAQVAASESKSSKAIIMVLLPGGPPHLDMYDMKPDAPLEIRGEFRPISTTVPGIEICELLPRLARSMDKLAVIRSLYGGVDDHNVHQCLTGWESHPQQGDSGERPGYPPGGWPSVGAVLSKLVGPADPAVPPFVSLAPAKAESNTRASLGQAGYLGPAHSGFETHNLDHRSITLQGVSLERLSDRHALLRSLDRLRRRVDTKGYMEGLDTFTQQALSVITSPKLANALDLRRVDAATRGRYGIPDSNLHQRGGGKLLEGFLVARRLVEEGARCVTLAFSPWPMERESQGGYNWDWHTDNFKKARLTLPMLDQGLSALVEDLYCNSLLDDVAVVVWGEFGRTPRINRNAGRDHWPQASSVLLAGGGLRGGQAVGSTNRYGEYPQDRPVHYREIFATLYHTLGIDVRHTTLTDLSGRPQYLVDNRQPIAELL